MMLKKAIIFEGNTTNATENWTFHEMVSVRSEAVDDIYSNIQSVIWSY